MTMNLSLASLAALVGDGAPDVVLGAPMRQVGVTIMGYVEVMR
jgi:hypothetical protein